VVHVVPTAPRANFNHSEIWLLLSHPPRRIAQQDTAVEHNKISALLNLLRCKGTEKQANKHNVKLHIIIHDN